MKKEMSKKSHTQDHMKSELAKVILNHINDINAISEMKGIPSDGITSFLGEIGMDGKEYELSISWTPKGMLDGFKKGKKDLTVKK